MIGNSYNLYVRGSAVFSIVNPEANLPGEPPIIEFNSIWKQTANQLLQVVNPPNCPSCPGMVAVDPNHILAGSSTAEIYTSEEVVSGLGTVRILDSRNKTILKYAAHFPITFDPSRLEPAAYKAVYESENGTIEAPFYVVGSENSAMSVSPNPAFQKIDQNATIRMLDLPEGHASVSYQLTDFGGTVLNEWIDSESTTLPLEGLTPGTYVLKGVCGEIAVQQDIDFLLRGSPYITLSPNPTSDLVHVRLWNPVYPLDDSGNSSNATEATVVAAPIHIVRSLDYVVSDGISIVATGSKTSEQFDIDMSSFPSGIYTISVTDGQGQYAKHLQVIH